MITDIEKLIEVNSIEGKVGLVGGYFDLLHIGHISFLEQCKLHCDKLIVYIHNDITSSNVKGRSRPIVSALERSVMLDKLQCTDFVTIIEEELNEDSMSDFDLRILADLNPDVYFCVVENSSSLERVNTLNNSLRNVEVLGIPRQNLYISTTSLEKTLVSGHSKLPNDEFLRKIHRTSKGKKWVDILIENSQKSKCKIAKVAALIVSNDQIVSIGINESNVPCWCFESQIEINKYSHPKCLALHAEHNALLSALEDGKSRLIEGSTLYILKSPCLECSKLIIRFKIKKVVYVNEYTQSEGRNLLLEHNVIVERYIGDTKKQ